MLCEPTTSRTKQKIIFDVTIGSKWPEGMKEINEISSMRDVRFPEGGVFQSIEIEFNQKTQDLYNDACEALKEYIEINHGKNETYHIWYWWWL
jgi:hypothetical protein